jgi:hypothetical protein
VISKVDSKKAAAHSGNYQDNISILLTHEHNDDTIANDELDGSEITDSVLSRIERVDNLPLPTPSTN